MQNDATNNCFDFSDQQSKQIGFLFFQWLAGCDYDINQSLNLMVHRLRIYDEAIRNQRDADAAMKEMRRMTGVAWVGAKHGGVFTGNLPVPGAAFLYQIEGQRIVACAPAMELLGMMHTHDAAALPDEINAEMAPEMIKDCV